MCGTEYTEYCLTIGLTAYSIFSFLRYKSRSYRSRTIREPRKVLREFGTEIPPEVSIHVHDSTADCRYLVIPLRPAGTEGWSDEQLRSIVTRDSMIGVSVIATPTVTGEI